MLNNVYVKVNGNLNTFLERFGFLSTRWSSLLKGFGSQWYAANTAVLNSSTLTVASFKHYVPKPLLKFCC